MSINSSSRNILSSDDTTPPITTHTLDPPIPDGDNGWYVSDVEVTLTATDDMSGVKEIKYRVNGEPTKTIIGDNGTFIVDIDKDNLSIEYWAIDNADNIERENTFYIDMDQTDPCIDLTYTIKNKPFSFNLTKSNVTEGWTIILNATATDVMSGMECVEFYLNDVLQDTVYGPGPFYTWSFIHGGELHIRLWARAYDNAGNMGWDEIIEPGWINIKQSIQSVNLPTSNNEKDCIECQTNNNPLAEKLLNRLEKNEVLSNVIDLSNPDDSPICILLNKTIWRLLDKADFFIYLIKTLPEGSILREIYGTIAYIIGMVVVGYISGIAFLLNCEFVPH